MDTLRLCVTFIIGLAALATAPTAGAVTLGMADDAALVYHHTDAAGLLDAGQAHGAQIIRTIVRADRPEDAYLQLAEQARDRGMTFHATLAVSPGQTVDDYATWTAAITAKLQQTGAMIRVGLLNEPDLTIPAADACDPETTSRVLQTAGATIADQHFAYRVARTKIVRVRVRRHGRSLVVKRRVPVTKIVRKVTRRHGKRLVTVRRVRVFDIRYRTVSVPENVEWSSTRTTLTARGGCMAIMRARGAAIYLRAAIPAIRAVAPNVEIAVGETSPSAGAELFVRELARVGVPSFDAWAHHPYGIDGAADLVKVVRDVFGPTVVDFTEFGVARSDDSTAVDQWQRIAQIACKVEARSLIAYQWQTEPGARWDTSLLDPGLMETAQAQTFRSLTC